MSRLPIPFRSRDGEGRPKQIRMTEIPNSKHFEDLIDGAYVSYMFCFRIPSFGIRNSEAFDLPAMPFCWFKEKT